MKLPELVDELKSEVSSIMSSDFTIEVTETQSVPHSSDQNITFPDLDGMKQKTKLLSSCVLYIDIRRSTQLTLQHRPKTVAKLYSAFVRAMTRCARHYKGHVRGIIGDRVMVIFDKENAFANAVKCAYAMNSAAKYAIDQHFKNGEIRCGIGIDSGNMLVTKTGVRRRGAEQAAYRNLVWLGRPANVASKLTDLANKPGRKVTLPAVHVGSMPALGQSWTWETLGPSEFLGKLIERPGGGPFLDFTGRNVQSFLKTTMDVQLEPETPPILMTRTVWEGYKDECPNDGAVVNGWIKKVPNLQVPGYDDTVFGGDVILTQFK